MRYYVNRNSQAGGEHEVHRQGCPVFPSPENARYIGDFLSCREARIEAKRQYLIVDGCAVCSPECHTR